MLVSYLWQNQHDLLKVREMNAADGTVHVKLQANLLSYVYLS